MQLALELSDAAVDYHPDWPPASGLRARVAMDGPRARVQADEGEVLGARLREALVDVDMAASARRLRVGGRVEADLGQVLELVNGSPLAAITKGALREWRGSGPTSVDLDLDLPLGQRINAANARIGVHALLNHPRGGVRKITSMLNPKLHLIGLLPVMVEANPFQRENFLQLVQKFHPILIPYGPKPGQYASMPRRSAVAACCSAARAASPMRARLRTWR